VLKTATLPREFSALCPNCGGRKFYLSAEIHDRKRTEETAPHSARIEFGASTAIDSDQMAENLEQPKSRLGEIASWLLK
jgi:predicted  nucleic acid-binding Zn-ribbon protein